MPKPSRAADPMDGELDAILTSFNSAYTWHYGSVKEGLRALYEKAKREQWNATTQLAWDTHVEPESEIIPAAFNPLENYGPFQRCSKKEQAHFRHATLAWQLSQFLHGEQGALVVGLAARRAPYRGWTRSIMRLEPDDGRGAPRRGLRDAT